MPDDTHLDAMPPPAPADETNGRRGRRRSFSPRSLLRVSTPEPPPPPDADELFADKPTAVKEMGRELLPGIVKACAPPPSPPWWRSTVLAVLLGGALTAGGWAAATLLGADKSAAVHDVQIDATNKRIDSVTDTLGKRIDETNGRLDRLDSRMGRVEDSLNDIARAVGARGREDR